VSYLLDTNVVSEWVKPRPAAEVVDWLSDVDEDRVHISVITLAELRHGVERLPAGRRRQRLDDWLRHDLPDRFEGRVLTIDAEVAQQWGTIVARRDAAGRPIGVMDAWLAALAETHELTLVTRNTADFDGSVASLFNPWRD
jgi:predicted nucleic acid-binding protein